MAIMYQVFFMSRRLIYAAILINWLDRNYFQIQMVILKTSLFLIYIGSTRPYQTKLSNFVELVNEIITTICAYILVTFSNFVLDAKTRFECGWPMVGGALFLIIFNLLIICYKMIANLIHKCKLRC